MSEVERGAGGQRRFGLIPKFGRFLVLKPPLRVIRELRKKKSNERKKFVPKYLRFSFLTLLVKIPNYNNFQPMHRKVLLFLENGKKYYHKYFKKNYIS